MAVSRREFLRAAIATGVAAGLGGCVSGDAGRASVKAASQPGDLPRRVLGRTGQRVTILGLGTGCVARKKGQAEFDENRTRATIEAALEGGIRYFDTSPDYFKSEERLGPALAPVRNDIFLVTKVNSADARGCENDLASSLKLLKTSHVDLLLLHSVGDMKETTDAARTLGKGGALEFLKQARKDGRTRFIGMSIHEPLAHAQKLLEVDDWDVVMPFVNYVSACDMNAEEHIVEPCHDKGLGVVAMKVLGGGGQLADDYDRAFRYALSVPGVACALVGCASGEEVRRAVRAAREFRPLTNDEMRQTLKLGAKLVQSNSVKAAMLREHYPADLWNCRRTPAAGGPPPRESPAIG